MPASSLRFGWDGAHISLHIDRESSFSLEPHEQAALSSHIRHVMDFCEALEGAIKRSRLPPAGTPLQHLQHPETPPHTPMNHLSGSERASVESTLAAPAQPVLDATPIPDRLYFAGVDFAAVDADSDINIRKGDRVKMVMIMDDGLMVLGTNIETGAMGMFSVDCIKSGAIISEDEEAANKQQFPPVEVIDEPTGLHLRTPPDPVGNQRNPGAPNWSPVPVPNPLNRRIGRHVASRSYQSGSVLEASLERGDEVEIIFWEDDEIAVGIHIPSQLEGYFRGSMLVYVGSDASPAAAGPSLGQPAVEDGTAYPPPNLDRNQILVDVITMTRRDADQYKTYLDNMDRSQMHADAEQYNPTPGSQSSSGAHLSRHPPSAIGTSHLFNNVGMANSPVTYSPDGPHLAPPVRHSSAPRVPEPTMAPAMTPERSRNLEGAKHVLTELHSTEESYMNLLQVFMEHVIEPMKAEKILSNVDIDRAFKHLKPIHELSQKVEEHLRQAAQSGTGDSTPVVNLFLNNIQHEEWIVYENYIKNYQPATQIIKKMLSRTDAKGDMFRQFCRRIESDPACDRKNLDDFMMLPIQRITRYHLLLERLKRYMEQGTINYESVKVAEQYMKNVGNIIQEVQMREEEMRKMFEIVNSVDHCPSSILSYSRRRFVAEYDCTDLVGSGFGYGL
ncbi:hypothetical protein HK101_003795, partial [Irineochytrium annulatum]